MIDFNDLCYKVCHFCFICLYLKCFRQKIKLVTPINYFEILCSMQYKPTLKQQTRSFFEKKHSCGFIFQNSVGLYTVASSKYKTATILRHYSNIVFIFVR